MCSLLVDCLSSMSVVVCAKSDSGSGQSRLNRKQHTDVSYSLKITDECKQQGTVNE
jgi:hypothetical protein